MSDSIKETREKFPAIAELWDYSRHFWNTSGHETASCPWECFRDLIGHSEDRYGEETGCKMPTDYTSLANLGHALICYDNHGHDDIYDAVDAMMYGVDDD
mgnify:CR=1 FL=1